MDRLFLSVLNMSLIGAFVIAAICLARLPLRKAPKIISYCLWAVAGFRLVFPFSIESVFSLMPIKPQPIPADIAMQAVPHIDSGIPFVNSAVSSILPVTTPQDSANQLQIWMIIGAYLWIIGVAVMLIYSVVSIIRLKRGLRGAAHLRENIYESASLKTPLVIGMFRPRIYLPAGLTGGEYEYILLHEQTHIRRHDHIVKMLAYFVLCLHWFNPLVWAAFLLMGADMEMSCDERVLKELGGDIKSDYSMSLVRIAAGRRILNGSPLAFGEGGMKERIKRVLNFKKPSRIIVITAVVLAAVLSVGFALSKSGATPRELKNLSADDIVSFTVMAQPPGETKAISSRLYISSLADYLRSVVTYNQDDSYKEYNGQWTEFTLTMKSGETLSVAAYNPFIIINGVGYRTKYEPCEALNSFANNLLSTQYADAPIADLSSLRTPYVGDNSAVGKILDALPPLDDTHIQRFYALGTKSEPYSLTVYYEPKIVSADGDVRNIENAPKIEALLFALIDNLNEVTLAFRDTPSGNELDESAYKSSISASRDMIEQYLADNYNLSIAKLQADWNGSIDKLFAPAINAPPANTFKPTYQPTRWVDFADPGMSNAPNTAETDLFPGVVFSATRSEVTATDGNGTETLFTGMPILNVYMADLNGDNLPEICATVLIGSGIGDRRIVVYDYANKKTYELSDRMVYDYGLSLENGQLKVTQTDFVGGAVRSIGSMAIKSGELVVYGIDRTKSTPEPSSTASPQPASNLDDTIDVTIASHNSGKYGGGGDYAAASHVTLKTVENGNLVTAYVMAYYAEYTNVGGIHETAGSHIPVAITLEKPGFGLVEYWEAKDGSYYLPSIHEKFPSDIWDKVDTQLYVKEQQANCLQKATAYYASLPPATAENSLYQAYYLVALKLYEMDAGLNSNTTLIGFDINSVPESERGLLEKRLTMWVNGKVNLKPYFATYDELVKMGLIITDPVDKAGFTDGVLIRFYESSYQDGVLTVKADKYRTPLGAVGAEFTVRFKDGNWTVDEPGMVWMS